LRTNRTGEEKADVLCRMMPCANIAYLIFQQLGVAVRTHCHRWGSWKEMNLVVERARRRKTLGFGKQISKLIK